MTQIFCYVIRDENKEIYAVFKDIDKAKQERHKLHIKHNMMSVFEIVQVRFFDYRD